MASGVGEVFQLVIGPFRWIGAPCRRLISGDGGDLADGRSTCPAMIRRSAEREQNAEVMSDIRGAGGLLVGQPSMVSSDTCQEDHRRSWPRRRPADLRSAATAPRTGPGELPWIAPDERPSEHDEGVEYGHRNRIEWRTRSPPSRHQSISRCRRSSRLSGHPADATRRSLEIVTRTVLVKVDVVPDVVDRRSAAGTSPGWSMK
jgi:hypothetical protein